MWIPKIGYPVYVKTHSFDGWGICTYASTSTDAITIVTYIGDRPTMITTSNFYQNEEAAK